MGAVGREILSEAYYIEAHAHYGCFPRSLGFLCDAVNAIGADPVRSDRLLRLGSDLAQDKQSADVPLSEGAMDMLPALAVAANVPAMIEKLLAAGFPREIAENTAREIDGEIVAPLENGGSPGLNGHLVKWFRCFLRGDIVRIGRFNFERGKAFGGAIRVYRNGCGELVTLAWNQPINSQGGAVQQGEETAFFALGEESCGTISGHRVAMGRAQRERTVLPADEWTLALQAGDPVVHLHIPAGERFDPEYVERSYKEAFSVLEHCWKDWKPKALVCRSWLMEPALEQLLPPGSNILAFQKPFVPFPSRGRESALENVFGFVPESYGSLPENTSLQRALKAYYLSGRCIRFVFAFRLVAASGASGPLVFSDLQSS